MATVTIDVKDLPARFAEVVSLVESGTDVTVSCGDENRVLRIPAQPASTSNPDRAETAKRTIGQYSGQVWVAADFDAPLPDEYWSDSP